MKNYTAIHSIFQNGNQRHFLHNKSRYILTFYDIILRIQEIHYLSDEFTTSSTKFWLPQYSYVKLRTVCKSWGFRAAAFNPTGPRCMLCVPPTAHRAAFTRVTHVATSLSGSGRTQTWPQPLLTATSSKGDFHLIWMLWCRRLTPRSQEWTCWKLRSLQAVQSKSWTHLCTSAMLITISAPSLSSPIAISIFCHHFTPSSSLCIYSLSHLCMEKLHHVLCTWPHLIC